MFSEETLEQTGKAQCQWQSVLEPSGFGDTAVAVPGKVGMPSSTSSSPARAPHAAHTTEILHGCGHVGMGKGTSAVTQ